MNLPSKDIRILLFIMLRVMKAIGGGLKMGIYMLENWVRKGEIPNDLK